MGINSSKCSAATIKETCVHNTDSTAYNVSRVASLCTREVRVSGIDVMARE